MERDILTKFTGELDGSLNPHIFISNVHIFYLSSHVSTDAYVTTFALFLDPDSVAMRWYDEEIKGKVTVWEELVKKFKQRFPIQLSSFQELYQVAWKRRDRNALFQDVEPGQKHKSLKIFFELNEDPQERILVIPEYRAALSDAKRWFVGQTPLKTKFTEEDFYWRSPVSEGEGEGEDRQMDIDVPDVDDTEWSDPSCPYSTFIVCGMPGIGKTCFLYYVLVERLLRNLPTCFQTEKSSFTYWCAEGVSEISTLGKFRRRLSNDVWFLVDSNQFIDSPDANILASGARIIQAASPRKARLQWAEKRSAYTYKWFMKPSPLPELLMMPFWPSYPSALTEEQVTTFAEKYGPSPRLIIHYARRLDGYSRVLQSKISMLDFDKLKQLVIEMKHSDIHDDTLSHWIFGVYPDFQRDQTTVDYLTRHIYGLIKTAFSDNWRLHARNMYRLFNSASQTRGAAGHLLEDVLHGDLPLGGHWEVTELFKRAKRLQSQKNTIFTTPTPEESRNVKYFFIGSDPAIVEAVPESHDPQPLRVYRYRPGEVKSIYFSNLGYYRPYAQNQATFDSLIVNHQSKSVFALQFTVSSEHSVSKYGMKFLKDHFSNYKCYYILVSDQKDVKLPVLSDYDQMWQSLWHLYVTEDALFSKR
ncbi:hypothetical protein E1B28_012217 [Marasmius oreades]|uniref:Crinkler (CRN) family protein n=1 Tax=Marasmius oreades TaxID=181124 RepID=A0A9P7RR82_9AGAR|nr:uncharacterized protein E1B28_012217 [Marasmius oreades]KAG7088200.1 hypothetical protein E1B28_012217 [Marasmius oreades]